MAGFLVVPGYHDRCQAGQLCRAGLDGSDYVNGRSTRSGGGGVGTFQRQPGTVAGGDGIHEGELSPVPGGPVQGQGRCTVRSRRQNVQLGSAGEPGQLRCDGRGHGRRATVAVPRRRHAGAGYRRTAIAGGAVGGTDEKFVQLGSGHRLDVGLLRVTVAGLAGG